MTGRLSREPIALADAPAGSIVADLAEAEYPAMSVLVLDLPGTYAQFIERRASRLKRWHTQTAAVAYVAVSIGEFQSHCKRRGIRPSLAGWYELDRAAGDLARSRGY